MNGTAWSRGLDVAGGVPLLAFAPPVPGRHRT
jgi:hypothetical protein